jgi:RNA polymerase sigma factor (sigma-70 family)
MELYLPLQDRLVRFARTMTRSAEDVEDLVGDTMIVALDGFERVRAPEAFLSYLFTIALRLHRRRTWRARIFGALGDDEHHTIASKASAPDESADVGFLRSALLQLPAKQRETVTLFEISGLSLEEIREVQGGSLSGVKSRLTRGRERLAELLCEPHEQSITATTMADGALRSYATNRGQTGND